MSSTVKMKSASKNSLDFYVRVYDSKTVPLKIEGESLAEVLEKDSLKHEAFRDNIEHFDKVMIG